VQYRRDGISCGQSLALSVIRNNLRKSAQSVEKSMSLTPNVGIVVNNRLVFPGIG